MKAIFFTIALLIAGGAYAQEKHANLRLATGLVGEECGPYFKAKRMIHKGQQRLRLMFVTDEKEVRHKFRTVAYHDVYFQTDDERKVPYSSWWGTSKHLRASFALSDRDMHAMTCLWPRRGKPAPPERRSVTFNAWR